MSPGVAAMATGGSLPARETAGADPFHPASSHARWTTSTRLESHREWGRHSERTKRERSACFTTTLHPRHVNLSLRHGQAAQSAPAPSPCRDRHSDVSLAFVTSQRMFTTGVGGERVSFTSRPSSRDELLLAPARRAESPAGDRRRPGTPGGRFQRGAGHR